MESEQIRALKRIDKKCLKYYPDKRGEVSSSGWWGICDGPTAVIYRESIAGQTGTFPHKLNEDGSQFEDSSLYGFIHMALSSDTLQSADKDCSISRVKEHVKNAKKSKEQREYAMWVSSDSGDVRGLFNSKLVVDVMEAVGKIRRVAISIIEGVKILVVEGLESEDDLANTSFADEEHLSVIGVVLSLKEDAYRDYKGVDAE